MKFNEYKFCNPAEINRSVLNSWAGRRLFERSIEERDPANSFVFFEGPPSANGHPGIHHVLARTIKDIVCRYKTMRGYRVARKAGWDTHGLPVELGVEKSLGITKEDIGKKISVDDYNAACRSEVMKFTDEWQQLTSQMGYWVDMQDPYITYDNRYIESVWWLLREVYRKGLLYKGYTIQPYSPAAGTGLSSHELNQPGCYRDVKDTTAIAQFNITNPIAQLQGWGKPVMLAWTTTPWTLPSNTALCVGPALDYCVVHTFNPYSGEPIACVVAQALLHSVFNPKAENLPLDGYQKGDKLVPWQVAATLKGEELLGMHYEQLFPWVNPGEGAFRVIPGDYVTTDDGTGIVHIAGTFGADDLRVSRAAGVPPLHLTDRDGNIRPMVDLQGRFYLLSDLDPDFVANNVDTEAYSEFAGRYVKNAYDPAATDETETLDVSLCLWLKQRGQVFKIEKHTHNYPHCWRTDKPVLYYPLDSWFIRSTAVRQQLLEANGGIQWKPASTGSGRFGKWLENLQDWNLSRSRYWGTPLPIWRTEDAKEEICIGSVEELSAEIDKAVAAGLMASNPLTDKGFQPGVYTKENYDKIDLHRPYVDDIILLSPSGRPMRRELDLIDVWFDSGAMPFAQMHYPFEHKDDVDSGRCFPADFIAEGVDQTRGWFFTLHAIAGMVKQSVAYKAVISNGLVLDRFGNKMSKRLGNAVDPFQVIDKYGSDPLRWYMISNSSPWDNLKFDEEGVAEVSRKFFGTLFNTYNFLARYANVDGFDPLTAPQVPVEERPEIDRWVISVLNSLVANVQAALDDYEPTVAARAISDFVQDHLSNWYVRLNRARFWGKEMTPDKAAAYRTLYECLDTVALLMAPIAPFFADRLYADLHPEADSVHLQLQPQANPALIDQPLEQRMALAQKLCSMTLALRRKANLKVRQPLSKIMLPLADEAQRTIIEPIIDLVLKEVNVKEMELLPPSSTFLVKKVKPDFKKLGPVFGKQMKTVAAAIQAMEQEQILTLERTGQIDLTLPDGAAARVTADTVEIFSEDIPGWLVANEGTVTVALDITVTDAMRREGMARELVNRIQNLRKSRDYNITDHIHVVLSPAPEVLDALSDYADYIAAQTLADSITTSDSLPTNDDTLDIDGLKVNIQMTKI